MAHRLHKRPVQPRCTTTQHIEQPDLVTAIPQTSNHGAPDARADPCGFPALREHRRIRRRSLSGVCTRRHSVRFLAARTRNREGSRHREPPAAAGLDTCAGPASGLSYHSGSQYIARPGVNTNPQCSMVCETKMRPVGPATIERSISSRPRQQQSTRLRGEALPHGIVAGQPTQHVICRPNAARGLVRAGHVALARYRNSPQGSPCGDPARGALRQRARSFLTRAVIANRCRTGDCGQ